MCLNDFFISSKHDNQLVAICSHQNRPIFFFFWRLFDMDLYKTTKSCTEVYDIYMQWFKIGWTSFPPSQSFHMTLNNIFVHKLLIVEKKIILIKCQLQSKIWYFFSQLLKRYWTFKDNIQDKLQAVSFYLHLLGMKYNQIKTRNIWS